MYHITQHYSANTIWTNSTFSAKSNNSQDLLYMYTHMNLVFSTGGEGIVVNGHHMLTLLAYICIEREESKAQHTLGNFVASNNVA